MGFLSSTQKYKRTFFWGGILSIELIFFHFLPKNLYLWRSFHSFFEWQKNGRIGLFSSIPFSIGDILYLFLFVALFFFLFRFKKKNNQGKKLSIIMMTSALLYLFYQISWGICYHTPALEQKENSLSIEEKELYALLYRLVTEANILREEIPDSFPSQKSRIKLENLGQKLFEVQKKLPDSLKREKHTSTYSVKKSLYSPLFSYLGVFGYYNPFTAEAQINTYQPDTSIPFTIAHEMAHQMGYARESEASFIGYVLATESENTILSYSAKIYAIRLLLAHLSMKDRTLAEKIIKALSPKIQLDLSLEKKYKQQYSGVATHAFSFLNDLFLKSNRQEGIISYSYATSLILNYEKKRLETQKGFQPKHK